MSKKHSYAVAGLFALNAVIFGIGIKCAEKPAPAPPQSRVVINDVVQPLQRVVISVRPIASADAPRVDLNPR